MRSQNRGKNTSEVEIQEISKHGVWLYAKGREYFLPFTEYPWFKSAKISEIQQLKLLHGKHLYWPGLDIDLELESLKYPEKYPLIYRAA